MKGIVTLSSWRTLEQSQCNGKIILLISQTATLWFILLKNNIALHFIADGSLLNFISETDLYSLFGNIIDNAIESVMKFENKDDRVISLKVIKRNGGVFIMEENPFKGKLVFQNGLPVTTKDNESGFHGYGSKSIQTIVESYGGILKISDENQCFSLFAFFPGK